MVKTVKAVIREAGETDLPRILDLLEQLSAGSSRGARLRPELNESHRQVLARLRDNPNYHLLVADVDGEVLGTCTLYLLPDMDGVPTQSRPMAAAAFLKRTPASTFYGGSETMPRSSENP